MSIDVLVAEYPGDRAWSRFAETFPVDTSTPSLPVADALLSKVLIAEMGLRATEWLAQPLRALGGLAPAEVLADHPQGVLAVRSLLMRMPR